MSVPIIPSPSTVLILHQHQHQVVKEYADLTEIFVF